MRMLILVSVLISSISASAAGLECFGYLHGRGHTANKTYPLTPMEKDKTLLIAKVGEFSFVVDTIELKKLSSLRLFIHDLKGDYTAMSDGVLKPIGSQKEARLQQIIGYDTSDPLTLGLTCLL